MSERCNVLVIGGGPAGIAAACRAAEMGRKTVIVDDNPDLGGQIWRKSVEGAPKGALAWYRRLALSGACVMPGARIVFQPTPGTLVAETADGIMTLEYGKLILATGARELFLPFPGWTLPNVMGAGGLQAMVKGGLPVAGKRIVVAGSGPLLLAVAAYLQEHGAVIAAICEQASTSALARFAASLTSDPGKLKQGLQYRIQLKSAPYRIGWWPAEAVGSAKLEKVVITNGSERRDVACDFLACGFHLVPNVELAQLVGCELTDGCVQVNDAQETTVQGVFCAGEPTGVGGLDLALVEGEIAGLMAAGNPNEALGLFARREKCRRIARAMDEAFAPRPELRKLATPETLLCRCEDVRLGAVEKHTSWRSAKLHTRCGMGPCQGRICGAAAEYLFGWKTGGVRPPAHAASIAALTAGAITDDRLRPPNPHPGGADQ